MKRATNIITITLILLTLIIGCLASSCSPVKQNQREHRKIQKAKNILREYNKLDDLCSEEFPIKEVYIKGDSVVHFDTLYMGETEFVTEVVNDTVFITKTLPPKTITKTVTIRDTVVKENTARVEQLKQDKEDILNQKWELQNKLTKAETEAKAWKSKARKRNWLLIALASVFVGWQFRGKLFPLISKLLK